jgi:hypothetical protein
MTTLARYQWIQSNMIFLSCDSWIAAVYVVFEYFDSFETINPVQDWNHAVQCQYWSDFVMANTVSNTRSDSTRNRYYLSIVPNLVCM